MQDNLQYYLNSKFTAGKGRILLTKWFGQAWGDLSVDKEMITTSFKKCGFSTAADPIQKQLGCDKVVATM